MSARYHCHDCHQIIPAGQAVLRSRSFAVVAWCHACYAYNFLGVSRPEVCGHKVRTVFRKYIQERG